jgi:hypothetical protein
MAIIPWLADCFHEKLITEKDTGLPSAKSAPGFHLEAPEPDRRPAGFGDLLAEAGSVPPRNSGKGGDAFPDVLPRAGKFGGYREHWSIWGFRPGMPSRPRLDVGVGQPDALVSHSFISMLWGAAFTVGQNA